MDFFPLTLALGKAFCNRTYELKQLGENIAYNKPSLIASPRRYGKTSLALNAITHTKLPYAQFDFLSATNEEDIEKIILKEVGKLISKIEKGPRKALRLAVNLFAGLNIKAVIDTLGLSIEINQKKEKPAYTILKVLERIDNLSKKQQIKLILFFDEFQRLIEFNEGYAIESVLRQLAQQSKNLMFIFSGSNRHLLNQMFNSKNRPFYKLCSRISLDRIAANEYKKFIQRAAQKTWSKPIEENVLERIIYYTERHPYYINLLCSRLWQHYPAKIAAVDDAWLTYVTEERAQVAAEIDLLSRNQRKLLIMLARFGETNSPRGREFENFSGMPSTTITQSLKFLEMKDYIYKDASNYYRILDPLIKATLSTL